MGGRWRGEFATLEIAPDLVLLRAGDSSWPSPGNVVVVRDGDGAALIDCGFGTADGLEALAAGLKAIGRTLESVHTVVCTHPHTDHAGAAAALAADPARRILVPAGARAVLDDARLVAAAVLPDVVRELAPELAGFDAVGHFRDDCGSVPWPAGATVAEVRPDEVIRLGAYEWTAVATPGHDSHLMCYWERGRGWLVYSDLLVTSRTAIPWYAPGGGGTGAYLASLDAVARLAPVLGISGHGGLLDGAAEVRASVTATRERIVERSERIAAALSAGPVSFRELERCVYPVAVHEVIPWASGVAAVHLLEALESGAARRIGDRFTAS